MRPSYAEPVETYATNVMGTVHVLEAVRQIGGVRAVVDRHQRQVLREPRMGARLSRERADGRLRSVQQQQGLRGTRDVRLPPLVLRRGRRRQLASARAGNVIGGGDWAHDRLVPDFFRALDAGVPVRIRSPDAVRPWQHVLEPLAGYLALAEALANDGSAFAEGWNFGPSDDSVRTVGWIVNFLRERAGVTVNVGAPTAAA